MGLSFKKLVKDVVKVSTAGVSGIPGEHKSSKKVSGQVTGQAAMDKAEKKQEKMDEIAKRQLSEADAKSMKQAELLAAKKRGRARTGGYGSSLGSQTSLGG